MNSSTGYCQTKIKVWRRVFYEKKKITGFDRNDGSVKDETVLSYCENREIRGIRENHVLWMSELSLVYRVATKLQHSL